MNLLNSIIGNKFFDTLRTKEQLGYIVQSKIKEIGFIPHKGGGEHLSWLGEFQKNNKTALTPPNVIFSLYIHRQISKLIDFKSK